MDILYLLIGHVVGLFRALSRRTQSPETRFAMLCSSLCPVLLSDKHDETPLAAAQWTYITCVFSSADAIFA
jgi:hypothetical protein